VLWNKTHPYPYRHVNSLSWVCRFTPPWRTGWNTENFHHCSCY